MIKRRSRWNKNWVSRLTLSCVGVCERGEIGVGRKWHHRQHVEWITVAFVACMSEHREYNAVAVTQCRQLPQAALVVESMRTFRIGHGCVGWFSFNYRAELLCSVESWRARPSHCDVPTWLDFNESFKSFIIVWIRCRIWVQLNLDSTSGSFKWKFKASSYQLHIAPRHVNRDYDFPTATKHHRSPLTNLSRPSAFHSPCYMFHKHQRAALLGWSESKSSPSQIHTTDDNLLIHKPERHGRWNQPFVACSNRL